MAFVSTLIIVGYQQYDAQTMSDDDIALTTSSSDDEEDDTDDDEDLTSDDEEEVDDQDSTEDETDESNDEETDANTDGESDVESESESSVASSYSEVSRTYSSSSTRTYSRGGTTHNPARAGGNSGTRHYAYKPVTSTADSQTVYVSTRIPGRYHKDPNCHGLKRYGGATAMTLTQAKQKGYVAYCAYERYGR